MGGGLAPYYENFKKGDKAHVKARGEIGIVEYFYYWGGGILVKLTGINNPNDPFAECFPALTERHQGEFWQTDLEKVV